jgi:DNA mismatch repair protein MutS
VIGYFISIGNAKKDLVPKDYIVKQTLVSGSRYSTQKLKELENQILGAEERILDLENSLFLGILELVYKTIGEIQKIARHLALIDVLTNLARTAIENNYSKPIVNDGKIIEILSGRHPIVERHIDNFISNDMLIYSNELVILTGPNMAGKSTFMRQIALIVLMAQIGSFVPCKHSKIGVVDRIFTRVGAHDILSQGQSTFMVEMSETANILNNATSDSLIIIDELGRGTSTYDGVSLAWAIAEYIYKHIKAKTIFATHYHVLNKLSEEYKNIRNYNILVKETTEGIVFLRKVVEGSTDKSYGIHVAKLAGIPKEIIERSKDIQEQFFKDDDLVNKISGKKDAKQLGLFRDWKK